MSVTTDMTVMSNWHHHLVYYTLIHWTWQACLLCPLLIGTVIMSLTTSFNKSVKKKLFFTTQHYSSVAYATAQSSAQNKHSCSRPTFWLSSIQCPLCSWFRTAPCDHDMKHPMCTAVKCCSLQSAVSLSATLISSNIVLPRHPTHVTHTPHSCCLNVCSLCCPDGLLPKSPDTHSTD